MKNWKLATFIELTLNLFEGGTPQEYVYNAYTYECGDRLFRLLIGYLGYGLLLILNGDP